MSKRPNILMLMTDEHRANITGYEGNSVVRTPVLDELATTGVVFNNAYTPSPICIPARMCITSGQLPKTCGCLHYGDDLPPFYMTYPRRFSQFGYSTVACGRLHHEGPDQMQGWIRRIGMDPMMFYSPQSIQGRVEKEFENIKPGANKWSDAKEIRMAGVGRSPYVIEDEYAVEGALHFIEQYFNSPVYGTAQSDRPLLLHIGLLQPHYPYITPDENKFGYYLNRVEIYKDQETFPHPWLRISPNMPSGRVAGKETHETDIELAIEAFQQGVPLGVRPGVDVTETEIRRAVAAYYAMIETADEMFGLVIDKLRFVGQDIDDWIIIYYSDHGEMLGEHGIWEKQKFFEGSVRVPLIIRWPRNYSHRIVTKNVTTCDLFATLCDLANIPAPQNLDSRSLSNLMAGNSSEWKDEAVSHFGDDFLMIKRDDLKYQYYGEKMPEVLFDLSKDPEETKNVINSPEYAKKVEDFRRRRNKLGYGPDATPNYNNAGY